MKLKFFKPILLSLLSLFIAIGSFAQTPKYVFYLIGDGMGAAQRQIAEYYLQNKTDNKKAKLQMNKLSVTGINTTHSIDSLVTDSAAAGTALATGYKTNNKMISCLADETKIKTLAEEAKCKNWTVAIISTTRITHATPAVFMAHNKHRDNENEIAKDIVNFEPDFVAGGGYRHFAGKNGTLKSKRKDDRDLITEFKRKGYKTFAGENSSKSFLRYKPQKDDKIVALFTYSHLPYEIDRKKVPGLPEITKKAIKYVSRQQKPFFMMIESGRIDHACHSHDPHSVVKEVLEFDKVVKLAYKFYKKHSDETLIIVTADHETGGLGLGSYGGYFIGFDAMKKQKASLETLNNIDSDNHRVFFNYLGREFGLDNLTENEKMQILNSIENKAIDEYEWTCQRTIGNIISVRDNVFWTSNAHTASPVVLTAEGVGADRFGGYIDNTEIAGRLADLLGFELGKF